MVDGMEEGQRIAAKKGRMMASNEERSMAGKEEGVRMRMGG
jgi:hypothetical protein